MPIPTVLWAQRSNATDETKNVIYLTVQMIDVKDVKINLTSTKLEISAKSQDSNNSYDLDLEFYEEIDPENSKKNLESGNHIYFILRKKEAKEEYWPRLIKQKGKVHYIKTDFDKWVDEDEQDEKAETDEMDMAGMGGMPGGMGGMPGMGGMGGMPGMGGMGGMPGMGGAGGPGGLDFASMMQSMGGMGGMGGEGGDFDISKLASQLGQAGGNLPDLGEDAEAGAETDEPQVEEAEEAK